MRPADAAAGTDVSTAAAADGVRIAWTSFGSGPALTHLPGPPVLERGGEAAVHMPRVVRFIAGRLGIRQSVLVRMDDS